MKKTILLLCFISLLAILTGCNSWNEKKAENLLEDYYNALIDGNYEEAFAQLYVYDDDYLESDNSLSTTEAEEIYLKKIEYLKEQKYKLTDFEILEVEYEDGHSFWHHVQVIGKQNEESFKWNEVVRMHEGKIVVHSDDPLVDYRNGKTNVEYKQ